MSVNGKNLACASAYEFMAALGVRTLHPGGREATQRLFERCHLTPHSRVLDVGCGAGTTALRLAREYGCIVSAVDVSEAMVARARSAADTAGLDGQLQFRVGNAHALPFENDEFDIVLSEAVLIFTDKPRALAEYVRVTCPGGYVGSLELSWQQTPPREVADKTREVICQNLGNLLTYDQWAEIFETAGLEDVRQMTWSMNMGIAEFMNNEGLGNVFHIWWRALARSDRHAVFGRMNEIFGHFNANHRYFGVGVYVGRKPG